MDSHNNKQGGAQHNIGMTSYKSAYGPSAGGPLHGIPNFLGQSASGSQSGSGGLGSIVGSGSMSHN